jgi:hypothetical protein
MELHQMLLVFLWLQTMLSAQKFSELNVMVTPRPMRPLGSQMGLKIWGLETSACHCEEQRYASQTPSQWSMQSLQGRRVRPSSRSKRVAYVCVSLRVDTSRSKRRRRCRRKNVRKKVAENKSDVNLGWVHSGLDKRRGKKMRDEKASSLHWAARKEKNKREEELCTRAVAVIPHEHDRLRCLARCHVFHISKAVFPEPRKQKLPSPL